ncbi:tol-pal system protein YbgF [Aestuariibius sp. 2305UL40-4]|uniref:tol-pal system protein YbgF n=1 Tax=Aestuariibius violaceus TaxID=3234132 RepID=UPI00345E65D8
MRRLVFSLMLACAPLSAMAQDREQTLADIRQELSVLFVEIQRLKRELSTTGGAQPTAGGSVLDRVNAIEAELQRLTQRAEQLEFRVDAVVRDGTNRIGDLEFRLCELEADCDIGSLGDTPSLGGEEAAPNTAPPVSLPPAVSGGSEGGPALATGEQADFDAAREAFESEDFRAAADRFAQFIETYPGGPLSSEAHFLRGRALQNLGEMTNAARAYLEAFSGAPDGPLAPSALTALGASLGRIGQVQDACTTLGEVAVRFPESAEVAAARQEMTNLGCS